MYYEIIVSLVAKVSHVLHVSRDADSFVGDNSTKAVEIMVIPEILKIVS
jgi:hypothetical protein